MQDVIITEGNATGSFNTEHAGSMKKDDFMKHYKRTHFVGFDNQDELLSEAWDKVQAKLGKPTAPPAGKDKSGGEGGK